MFASPRLAAGAMLLFLPAAAFGQTDSEEMAKARHALHHHAGGQNFWALMVERLELHDKGDESEAELDLEAWYGGDLHRVQVEVEGGYTDEPSSDFEHLELSLFWTKAISRYFDLKVGVRHDLEPKPERSFAVIGLQGLAPYWFETDGELFISEDGDFSARLEVEYDVLLTQKLIGQFRFELDAAAQSDELYETGSGLSTLSSGFRLRYEIRREFAPYVGVEWKHAFGGTADILRAAGEETASNALLFGLRLWY